MKENFAKLLEEFDSTDLSTDKVYTGVISDIDRKYVYIESNLKSSVLIPIDEFSIFDPEIKIGAEIDYEIKEFDNGFGQVLGSRKNLIEGKRWEYFESHKRENKAIKGEAVKASQGGLIVKVKDISCYIPKSLLDIDYKVTAESLVGQTIYAKVVKINKVTSSVVLSRKDQIKEDNKINVEDANYEIGQKVKGVIKNIADFGAFVDLGAKDALLHISEISWVKVRSISELFREGQEITCEIVNISEKDGKISLSIKSLIENPWEKYNVGDKEKAIVVRKEKFGVVCSFENGIEGVINNSNVDTEALEIGEEIQVEIENIEVGKMTLKWIV